MILSQLSAPDTVRIYWS